ncbi:hypothetical protein EW026_g3165 [Hermanssonia centrifuga]|uniref:GTP-binding protein 2 n=1 Tax=Hermanssonia centrifuga TaxID=98765 RepID=A0A4V3XAR4_9APHY|nr:hypothetical protein EW026_g3165 [Hermanssonia centrifuga]
MFGEDESESPRVSSPWDPFLPSPPGESTSFEAGKHLCNGIPKLVPEGNIEYKLKLTDISPARFARLVTQLKWRLLEGGGQAYYELGVADSGALIGLSRTDLEQSLETLETMAGEIGASVIVVKEIEVPSVMVALADKVSGYIDPETGEWTEKMISKRSRVPVVYDSDSATVTSDVAELETDASATDYTDTEEDSSAISTPMHPTTGSKFATALQCSRGPLSSNPDRPTSQSSPSILPIDDELALFSMDPEPPFHDALAVDANPNIMSDAHAFSLDIEISSVYKPRPIRRRMHTATGANPSGRHGRRGHKPKEKKQQPWRQSHPTETIDDMDTVNIPNKQETKALYRRIARDRRREEKRKLDMNNTASGHDVTAAALELNDEGKLVTGLGALHVAVESVGAVATDTDAPSSVSPRLSTDHDIVPANLRSGGTDIAKEPRLIVEALVVRKLSIDEAFLDFGGFSLI